LDIVKQYVKTETVFTLPVEIPHENIDAEIKAKYLIDFYEKPNFKEKYIITCDVAGGLFKDASAMNIIDPATFKIIGDFRNNNIDTDDYKKLIEEVLGTYFPNSILIVERNSYGLNIIQSLMKKPHLAKRMQNELVEAQAEKTLVNGSVVRRKQKKRRYGVDTTTKSRRIMFELLPRIVDEEPWVFQSPHIYKDLKSLIMDASGKITHRSTGHDDSLMSYLLFRYALHSESCLSKTFGISRIPSQSSSNVDGLSIGESFLRSVSNTIEVMSKSEALRDNFTNLDKMNKRQQEIDKYIDMNNGKNVQSNMFSSICNLN